MTHPHGAGTYDVPYLVHYLEGLAKELTQGDPEAAAVLIRSARCISEAQSALASEAARLRADELRGMEIVAALPAWARFVSNPGEHWLNGFAFSIRELLSKMAHDAAYALELREALEFLLDDVTRPEVKWAHGSSVEIARAALAKNPNPSGQSTTEASGLRGTEASGPVGLGPDIEVTGQFRERPSCDALGLDRPEKYCRMGECEIAEKGGPRCKLHPHSSSTSQPNDFPTK